MLKYIVFKERRFLLLSYCVNCGVELDKSMVKCPLCNAPVLNPFEEPCNTPPPYPQNNSFLPKSNRKFLGFLLSSVLLIPNIVFAAFSFLPGDNKWIFYTVTTSCLIWTVFIAPLLITKKHPYILWALDSFAVSLYIYLMAYGQKPKEWFLFLALPSLISCCIFSLFMIAWLRRKKRKWTAVAISVLTELALLSLVADAFSNRYYSSEYLFRFSIPFVAACAALILFFAAVSGNKRFELWLRRTFHI